MLFVMLCFYSTCWLLDGLVVAGSRRHGLTQGLVGTKRCTRSSAGCSWVWFRLGVFGWFRPHQTVRHLQGSSHLLSHVHQLRKAVKDLQTSTGFINWWLSNEWIYSTSESNSKLLLPSLNMLTFLSISWYWFRAPFLSPWLKRKIAKFRLTRGLDLEEKSHLVRKQNIQCFKRNIYIRIYIDTHKYIVCSR